MKKLDQLYIDIINSERFLTEFYLVVILSNSLSLYVSNNELSAFKWLIALSMNMPLLCNTLFTILIEDNIFYQITMPKKNTNFIMSKHKLLTFPNALE